MWGAWILLATGVGMAIWGAVQLRSSEGALQHLSAASDLPSHYSFFEGKYAPCMREPGNQAECNACTAFAISGAWTHRICKAMVDQGLEPYLPGSHKGRISYQSIFSCTSRRQEDCSIGQSIQDILGTLTRVKSFPLVECVPYTEETWKEKKTQSEKCYTFLGKIGQGVCSKYVHLNEYSLVMYPTVEMMKREIYENGPIVGPIYLYKSFSDFLGPGIYTSEMTKEPTNEFNSHAITICGWGSENGIDYWIIENQWGSIYTPFDAIHNRGFVRIQMGDDILFRIKYFLFINAWETNLYKQDTPL